jgi:hypothetical protein
LGLRKSFAPAQALTPLNVRRILARRAGEMNNLEILQEAAAGGSHWTDDNPIMELDFGRSAVAIIHAPQGYAIFGNAGVIEVFSDFADCMDWLALRQ